MRRALFGGLRFQKRIRVLPGVHLNLSLSGVGVSAGGRGFHVGMTARGQKYVSAGLPGTGLSVRHYAPKQIGIDGGTQSPRMNIMPVVIAVVVLAVLLLAALR
jgi:hypothetical protein